MLAAFLQFLKQELRADTTTNSTNTMTDSTLNEILQGHDVTTTVTKQQALNIPAVSSSVNFVGNLVASLPIRLYKKDSQGNIVEIENDPRLTLLNAETGDLLDAFQFKKALIEDMLLLGSGYAFVNWRRNRIVSLNYVENIAVAYNKNADPIFKVADYIINGQTYPEYKILRILRKTEDGITGQGVITEAPMLFAAMYNSLKYENNTMSRGGKKGTLQSENKLDKDAMDDLRTKWRSFFGNIDADNDVLVLNKGITFTPVSSTASENQLNENKQTNTEEVYSLFGLSEELFTSSTGTQDVFLKAIKTGIKPVITALETALNKFLLLEREKNTLRFSIDIKDILRGDTTEMYKAYETGIKNGFLQLDEVRTQEHLPKLGFKFVKLGLDSVLFDPKNNSIYVPNTGELIDLNNKTTQILGKGGKATNEN